MVEDTGTAIKELELVVNLPCFFNSSAFNLRPHYQTNIMKLLSFPLLILSLFSLSFTTIHEEKPTPLPTCAAIKKILADEGAAYTSFKGEAADKNDDGSENFTLKIALDGWSNHAWVSNEKGGGYVEIYKEHATKAKAIAQYNAVASQLQTCLGVKGESLQQEGIEKLLVFKKGKSEITLIVTTTSDKAIAILTVENAEGE